MDYKEVKKKNGSILVFCNFEELLMESYGVSSMEEVEPHAAVEGQEYIIRCPLCKHEHTKSKLYIKTDLTVGHCFLCDRDYVNVVDEGEKVSYHIPDFLGMFGGYEDYSLIKLSDPTWTLDRFKYEFDDYSEKGVDYLIKKRHGFMKDLYKCLDFRFFDDNIVIPFYFNNELIYYQIRFTGNSKIRYYLPPIGKKPPYIIERQDEDSRKRIMICEGVFDAVSILIQAPEYTPVAVLGSSISDYQLNLIRDYSGYIKEVRIWMDETDISKRIANKVKSVIDYCPINIIKSTGEDPEECMKRRLKFGLPVNGWIKSNYRDDKNMG